MHQHLIGHLSGYDHDICQGQVRANEWGRPVMSRTRSESRQVRANDWGRY